jgi:flagellar protein FliS
MSSAILMQQQAGRRYAEEQINGLTPVELLVRVYDVGIASCDRQDRDRLSRTLVELISALNFEHRDVAVGLFRLYTYCLREAKRGQFDAVRPILVELRDSWSAAAKSVPAVPR